MPSIVEKKGSGAKQPIVGTPESGTSDPVSAADVATGSLPPDWLTSGAAGLAAGWLFGPVGGVAGFLLSKFASGRRRQNILDQYAVDESVTGRINDSLSASLSDARNFADTDIDEAQLRLLDSNRERLMALSNHYDPQIRRQALDGLITLADSIGAELGDIEDTAIARRDSERANEQQIWQRFNEVSDDLQRESGEFIGQRDALGRIIASVANPSPAGDVSLVYNYLKLLDPTSTVMPGEQATIRNSGGIDERLRAFYNGLLDGTVMTDDQRNDFFNRARAIYSVSRSEQVRRNSRFMERARDGEVPDELLDTLQVALDPGELEFLPPPQTARDTIDADQDLEIVEPSAVDSGISRAGESLISTVERISMAARGERFARQGDRWFVVDKEGNVIRELDQAPEVEQRRLESEERARARREFEEMSDLERVRRFPGASGTIQRGGRPTN